MINKYKVKVDLPRLQIKNCSIVKRNTHLSYLSQTPRVVTTTDLNNRTEIDIMI